MGGWGHYPGHNFLFSATDETEKIRKRGRVGQKQKQRSGAKMQMYYLCEKRQFESEKRRWCWKRDIFDNGYLDIFISVSNSVSKLGDLFDFLQLFKAFGNN